MNLEADDLRRDAALGVEGSRELSMQSGHLHSEASGKCELLLIVNMKVASHFLPSVDLKDLASRAHWR